MREVISLHVGQAGCQIGQQCWELFCLDHGIKEDGQMPAGGGDDTFHSFFSETGAGKYVPRCVFVDSEPTVVDAVREGTYKQLFHPEQLITGNEDASKDFARGKYTVGKELVDQVLDSIRKLADQCTGLQGFNIYHALAGGTGSGFGSLLSERLSADYGKKFKLNFTVYPSLKFTTPTDWAFNSVFGMQSMIEHTDAAFIFDNESAYDICRRQLGIKQPEYKNVNQVMAQTISSLTSPYRFTGTLNVDLNEFGENFVPNGTKLKFLLANYAPFMSSAKALQPTTQEITNACFAPANQMIKVDPARAKYLAMALFYRGDVAPSDVNASVATVKASKRTIKFVDWCPTGIKVSISNPPSKVLPGGDMAEVQRSVCMVSNTTALFELFQRLSHAFLKLHFTRRISEVGTGAKGGYSKGTDAKVGMDAKDFQQAGDDLEVLLREYEDLRADKEDDEDAFYEDDEF